MSIGAAEVGGRRLELLRQAVSQTSGVAVLYNRVLADKALEWQGTQMAARALGATPYSVEMHGPDDFDGAFATLVRERPDALIMSAETLTLVHHRQIVEFAIQHRLAMIAEAKDFAAAGLS